MKNLSKIRNTILVTVLLLVLFFSFFNFPSNPPCLNADEASLAYNAYSILKTGKDEFGSILPLRLRSFEDYKMPLYTYLSIPAIALLGLNEIGIRSLNIVLLFCFVFLFYKYCTNLFKEEKYRALIPLLALVLISLTPWVYIISRQAHEALLASLLFLVSLNYFNLYVEKRKNSYFFLTNIFLLLSTFAYHTGRLYGVYLITLQLIHLFKNRKTYINLLNLKKIILLCVVFILPLAIDYISGINRVSNLLFYKNKGFELKINEYIFEHPNRLIHNKLTQAIPTIVNNYFNQISPDFLSITGDSNMRFGFPNLSYITQIELVFIFIGLYFMFANKFKYRYMLLGLFLIVPLGNSFTWQESSLSRTYFLIVPILLFCSYGVIHFLHTVKKQPFVFLFMSITIILLYCFFLFISWDLYFNHYPKRAHVIRSWQCGYKELFDYIKAHNKEYSKIYLTARNGQPYIFALFYLQVDPKEFQGQVIRTSPDEYGFSQVEKFDKFIFNADFDTSNKTALFVGFPDEVYGRKDVYVIKSIKVGTEEIFVLAKPL